MSKANRSFIVTIFRQDGSEESETYSEQDFRFTFPNLACDCNIFAEHSNDANRYEVSEKSSFGIERIYSHPFDYEGDFNGPDHYVAPPAHHRCRRDRTGMTDEWDESLL